MWHKYSHSSGTIVHFRGKRIALKKGSVFGLRKATSKKGAIRMITKEHGPTKVFTLDEDHANTLIRRSKPHVFKEEASRISNMTTHIDSIFRNAGLTREGTSSSTSTNRYVKRGFYDGDHPNAHQSITTRKQNDYVGHLKSEDEVHAAHKTIHSHLVKAGFKGYKVKRLLPRTYWKNSHEVFINTRGKTLKVSHVSKTTEPDLIYERSGRGRGQII